MTCRNCGTEIADKAIVCYRCGTATADPVRRPVEVRRRRSPVVLFLILLAVAAALVVALLLARSYHVLGLEVAPPGLYSVVVLIDFAAIHA
jgi:hypothetical protein